MGVARDAKYVNLRESTPPFVYCPTLQTQSGVNHLEVRTSGIDPLALAATIRSVIHDGTRLDVVEIGSPPVSESR